MARPDLDPRGGPPGPHPRRRRADADAAVDRPVLHLGDRARVHLRVRRQQRAGLGPGACSWAASSPSSSPCCCCCTSSTTRSDGDVGGLQPSAMERTELLIDQQLAVIGGDITIPCDDAGSRRDEPRQRRTPPSGAGAAGLGRDRRHRAAGPRRRRHRVEQLPGQPVERRDDQGVQPGQRPAHRGGPRPGSRPGPDPGRHRHVLPVGQRHRHRRRRARRLLHRPVPTRVPTGLRRLAGHRPADQPRRPADTVRHGRVPARRHEPTPSGSTPRPRSPRRSSAATSSAPPTTCSPSCCSPSPCSSPA